MTYLVFSMGLRANKRNETKTRGEARVVGEEGELDCENSGGRSCQARHEGSSTVWEIRELRQAVCHNAFARTSSDTQPPQLPNTG